MYRISILEWNFQVFSWKFPQLQTGALSYAAPVTRNFLITDQSKLTEAAQVVPWLGAIDGFWKLLGVIDHQLCCKHIVFDCFVFFFRLASMWFFEYHSEYIIYMIFYSIDCHRFDHNIDITMTYYRIHLNLHCLLNLLPLCNSCKIFMNWHESYRMIICLSCATRGIIISTSHFINQGRLPCCLETCVWHWELFWLQKQGRLWKTEVEAPQMMIQKNLVKLGLYFCNMLLVSLGNVQTVWLLTTFVGCHWWKLSSVKMWIVKTSDQTYCMHIMLHLRSGAASLGVKKVTNPMEMGRCPSRSNGWWYTVESWGNSREMGTFLLRNGLVSSECWKQNWQCVCLISEKEHRSIYYAIVVNGCTFFPVFYLIFEDDSQVLMSETPWKQREFTAFTSGFQGNFPCTKLRCYKEIVDELSTLVVPSSVVNSPQKSIQIPSKIPWSSILLDTHFLRLFLKCF